MTPEALELQLAALSERGYRGASFSDAVGGQLDGRVVAITFDDNYRSVLELAAPILERYGYQGTIFVPTDWPAQGEPMRWQGIDDWLGTPHEYELASLTWAELRQLADRGWEIGSHTCSHPRLTELDDGALARELLASKERIEQELARPCISFAYPYGDADARVLDATRQAGYRWAATIPRILSQHSALSWPRAPIYHTDDLRRFRAKVSPALRRLRASRFGILLDHARVAASEAARRDGTAPCGCA